MSPDSCAIEYRDRKISYGELQSMVRSTAAALHREGVGRGDHLGVCLMDAPEYLVAIFAAWRQGAIVVPMNYRAPVAEKRALVERFDIGTVIERKSPAEDPGYGFLVWDKAWIRQHGPADVPERQAADFARTAFISPTSGTTGFPKGIVQTHGEFLKRYAYYRQSFWRGGDDRFFSAFPLSFRASLSTCLSTLLDGGTVILFPTLFDTREWVEGCRRHRATSAFAAPPLIREMLEIYAENKAEFPQLRDLISGGGALSAAEKVLALEVFGPGFQDLYAFTLGGVVSILKGEEIREHSDTVGRPLDQATVEIVDEHGGPLKRGEKGLLRFKAPGMSKHLYGVDGEAVSAPGSDRIVDGWAYPGEIAYLDEENYIHLCGRASDVIVRGGSNVYPEEIEAVLSAHPDVAECAVVGTDSQKFGEEITAFVVGRRCLDEKTLRAFCLKRLAAGKRPREYLFVETLPKNPNGKVLRRKLKATRQAPRGD